MSKSSSKHRNEPVITQPTEIKEVSIITSLFNDKNNHIKDTQRLAYLTSNAVKQVLDDRLLNNINSRIKDLETSELVKLMDSLLPLIK